MLLNYTINTKDEDILPRAVELRARMARRHLQNAAAGGSLDEDTLIALKDKSKDALKEHIHEDFGIRMAAVTEKVTVARAEQQLAIESAIHNLGRDVNRASRLGRSKMDALGDLERRIRMMRHKLNAPGEDTVEEEIGKVLRTNNKAKAEKLFEICPRCNRKILVELFKTHDEACAKLEGNFDTSYDSKPPVYRVDQDLTTEITTFQPQPPRNCVVTDRGSTFITWSWEPPVSDGGLPIIDYEIGYTSTLKEMDAKTGKYKTTVTVCEGLRTSHWALINPICHNGYRLIGLHSGAEYSRFKIRCYNLRGPSEWTDMLTHEYLPGLNKYVNQKYLSVMTEEPDAPSPPVRFINTRVTSSCLWMEWDTPFYDGGRAIQNYTLHYTVVEKMQTTTEREVFVDKVKKFDVPKDQLSAVIRNIKPDTKVVNISITATNNVGLVSAHRPLGVELRTSPSCRYTQIQREIDKMSKSTDEFVDTDFYAGIMQRMLRVEFLKMLNMELEVTQPDPLEYQEAQEWAANRMIMEAEAKRIADAEALRRAIEEGDVEDKDPNRVTFTHRQRMAHYKRKVLAIEDRINELKHERLELDLRRGKLTELMKSRQKRQMELKLERDRIKNFKGDMVTTDILFGAAMQYQIDDVLKKIDHAFAVCTDEIASAKFEVISGENRKQRVKEQILKNEELLKERTARMLEYKQTHDKLQNSMNKMAINADQSLATQKHAWYLWIDYLNARRNVRNRVTKLFMNLIFGLKRSAFDKWRLGNFSKDSKDADNFVSAGSVQLQKVLEKRLILQQELREAIALTASVDQGVKLASMSHDDRVKLLRSQYFKKQEEGLNHVKMESEGLHFLYEADGYATKGNFQLAASMYEAQVMYLRSQPKLNIKFLAITHGRMGKMYLKSGRFDRAIVDFDRQLSLAREIDDAADEAEAYLGMGTGYLMRNSYDDAIKYLEMAQVRLAALNNTEKYIMAMRGLRECYDRLGKEDHVQQYTDKINKLSGLVDKKIGDMKHILNDLASRLSDSSAGEEMVVRMERMTYRALQLRKYINQRMEDIKEAEEAHKAQMEQIALVESNIKGIKGELDHAFNTDDTEMWSQYMHDIPQIVDVEALKSTLDIRLIKETKQLTEEIAKGKDLTRVYKNIEDDIQAASENFELEQGKLMKRTTLDKPFRVIAFCAANAAGDEVTGTSSGGVENYICGEGSNIHVIDYHTGELLNIMQGDNKDRVGDKVGHTAVVTCLVHDASYIFSGSVDELIISWNGYTWEKLKTFSGHEGSISALAVEGPLLISGSADSTARLWNKYQAVQVRVIHGHSKSVLSVELGPTWMLTGSSDEEVRVWDVEKKEKTVSVVCKHRLIGHEVSVTCVKYGRLEVFSGDILGRIFIWWMETATILRKCQVRSRHILFISLH